MVALQRRLRTALFSSGHDVKLKVILKRPLEGPPLPLTLSGSDMIFVLKVKIELALRLLRETAQEGSTAPLPQAEDIELEFRGVPLRDMMAIDRYGIESGAELVAAYAPQLPERETVPRQPGYAHLEDLIMAEAGVPSTGTVKRILAREGLGTMCQVCWRGRWFRAHVMQVYSTSLLLGWHDWPDSDWPNFFIRVALAAAPKTPPDPERDETWRIRWCVDTPTRDLPIVEPRFAELPPLNWVKAFLRCYASTDETQLLREIQSHLPRELIEARHQQMHRHRCLVLGASGTGKTTLIATLCAGPPLSGEDAVQGLPSSEAHSVILLFDVKSMASFRALGEVGGWLHEFTRLTGKSPANFPFLLVGNKAEDDLMHRREVTEEDVRGWLYAQGGRMPYIETTFGGDPLTSWRHAEHVFRTVARTAHRVKENLGRHQPPETARVPEEPDYLEANAASGKGSLGLRTLRAAARASLLGASLAKQHFPEERGERGARAQALAAATDGESLAERLVKPVASWAHKTGGEAASTATAVVPREP